MIISIGYRKIHCFKSNAHWPSLLPISTEIVSFITMQDKVSYRTLENLRYLFFSERLNSVALKCCHTNPIITGQTTGEY